MSERPMVLIAGAGLGGMAAAGCLLQKGYRVRVFEQAAELGEVGAGIHMSANAIKVLWQLGLADDIEKIGAKPKAYVFRLFHSGEILQTYELGEAHCRVNGAPYYQFHRADIHHLLARTVQRLDPEAIILNSAAEGFTQTGSTVVLHLSDGRREQGDVLIGADGIKSVIREQILGATEASFTGNVAWRIPRTERTSRERFHGSRHDSVGGPRSACGYLLRARRRFDQLCRTRRESRLDERILDCQVGLVGNA